MTNHFPDNVIKALIDTLKNVFWLKKDLRSLYERYGVPSSMIAAQDWNGYKYHIIEPVLSTLNSNEEGLGPLRRLLAETLINPARKYLRSIRRSWLASDRTQAQGPSPASRLPRRVFKGRVNNYKDGDHLLSLASGRQEAKEGG
ncbi:MAG TPA: hypothetical protein VNL74_08715 [Methylococcus sp.]|nr:hypothetical protein [Methylococcus sp.]